MHDQIALIMRVSLQQLTDALWDVNFTDTECIVQRGAFTYTVPTFDTPERAKEVVAESFKEYTEWLTDDIEAQLDSVDRYLMAYAPNERMKALKKWQRRNERSGRPRKPKPIRL